MQAHSWQGLPPARGGRRSEHRCLFLRSVSGLLESTFSRGPRRHPFFVPSLHRESRCSPPVFHRVRCLALTLSASSRARLSRHVRSRTRVLHVHPAASSATVLCRRVAHSLRSSLRSRVPASRPRVCPQKQDQLPACPPACCNLVGATDSSAALPAASSRLSGHSRGDRSARSALRKECRETRSASETIPPWATTNGPTFIAPLQGARPLTALRLRRLFKAAAEARFPSSPSPSPTTLLNSELPC